MLIQRALCRCWSKQITDLHISPKGLLLHHAPSSPQKYMLLRSFRGSTNKSQSNIPLRRTEFLVPSEGSVPPGNVTKALIFAGSFTIGSFVGATILEYENLRSRMAERVRRGKLEWLLRTKPRESKLDNTWSKLKAEIQLQWDQLGAGHKVYVPLLAANMLVFGLWRVPALRTFMTNYFLSNPAARVVCWPMFLSTFSHFSAFHILANMYVLHSFCETAVASLGTEQFLAVYLSGGVIASLASVMYKAMTVPAPSLGASGALFAILAYVCTEYPDLQLSLIFLPMVPFSAGAAIKTMMAIDFAACIMGWKFFDHAAHLGGALYGVFWAYFGTEIWKQRLPLMKFYHGLREGKKV